MKGSKCHLHRLSGLCCRHFDFLYHLSRCRFHISQCRRCSHRRRRRRRRRRHRLRRRRRRMDANFEEKTPSGFLPNAIYAKKK